MKLRLNEDIIEFTETALQFMETDISNVFAKKNNKTLKETVRHTRYIKFLNDVEAKYFKYMDKPLGLGEFLAHVKECGDDFYRRFLNAYGDGKYCKFSLCDKTVEKLKGMYTFCVDESLMYVGRCRDAFGKRINIGYGRICAKNCYIDGQVTNCHLNQLITKNMKRVRLVYHSSNDDFEISGIEEALIKAYNPKWNIALKEKWFFC